MAKDKTKQTPEETGAAEKEPEVTVDNGAETASAENDPLVSELESLKDELGAKEEKYLRLAAEYDNFRKRSQKEKDSLGLEVRGNTAAAFLPVYDNLERALKQETADEAFKKGVEMTMNQLKEVLGKLGVTEIAALGQKFDPEKHNAVMHVEDEAFGENEVVDVFQAGFECGGKVIRFAMVKVAN